MARIFLCHASEDKPRVADVYQRLHALGWQPWMDKMDLIPGQRWQQEIPRALRTSDFILIFFSRNSIVKRGYVQREFKLALDTLQEIPEDLIHTIPIRLDDCVIPPEFGFLQWCNFFEDDGFERLVQALRLGLLQRQHPESSVLIEEPVASEATIHENPQAINPEARRQQEAERAHQHKLQQQRDKEEKLERYKQTFCKVIAQYPLSAESKKELESRQRELGITPEEVERISQPLLAEAEAKYQENLRAAKIEEQRQQEAAQAQYDTEESEHALDGDMLLDRVTHPSSPSKTRLWVGGGIATAVALVLIFFWLLSMTDDDFITRGNAKQDKGNFGEAIADYTQAISIAPKSARAYAARARARVAQGDLTGALADYNYYLKAHLGIRDDASAYSLRGEARAARSDTAGAIADYTQAITVNPKEAQYYNYRGKARAKQGDNRGAIEDYTQATQLAPRQADAYFNRGLARAALGDKRGAIEDYTQVIQLAPYDYRDASDRIKKLQQ